MSEDECVCLRDVSFDYGRGEILRAVNLSIPKGDFACIVGPNGGGKTTLLKIILGLLTPTSGTVRVLSAPPAKVRTRIGYMPQGTQIDPAFPATVLEIVLMGRLGKGGMRYTKEDREAAQEALAQAKVADLQTRSIGEISGGERQRVLVARALASSPEVLIMDEPTANVDALAEEALYDLLQELNQRMTIVMVSHDLGFVMNGVKSVICVSNKKVALHPTSAVTGDTIRALYDGDIRLIRHDHRCAENGHQG